MNARRTPPASEKTFVCAATASDARVEPKAVAVVAVPQKERGRWMVVVPNCATAMMLTGWSSARCYAGMSVYCRWKERRFSTHQLHANISAFRHEPHRDPRRRVLSLGWARC